MESKRHTLCHYKQTNDCYKRAIHLVIHATHNPNKNSYISRKNHAPIQDVAKAFVRASIWMESRMLEHMKATKTLFVIAYKQLRPKEPWSWWQGRVFSKFLLLANLNAWEAVPNKIFIDLEFEHSKKCEVLEICIDNDLMGK